MKNTNYMEMVSLPGVAEKTSSMNSSSIAYRVHVEHTRTRTSLFGFTGCLVCIRIHCDIIDQ